METLIAQWRTRAATIQARADGLMQPVTLEDFLANRALTLTECADELAAHLQQKKAHDDETVTRGGTVEMCEGFQSSASPPEVVSAPAPNDCTPREEALSDLVWWMLGERDQLPPIPEPVPGAPRRNYWWRNELRARFEAIYEKYPSTGKVSR